MKSKRAHLPGTNHINSKKRVWLKKTSAFLAVLVFWPVCLFADWQQFNSGLFSVLLPGSPRKTGGHLVWVAIDSQKRAYNVTCKILEDFPISPKDYFVQMQEDLAAGLQGRLEYHKFIKFQGWAACEYKISTPKHVVVGRLVLTKPYLYSLEVASGSQDYDASSAGRFFDSLKLMPKIASSPESANNGQPSVQPW